MSNKFLTNYPRLRKELGKFHNDNKELKTMIDLTIIPGAIKDKMIEVKGLLDLQIDNPKHVKIEWCLTL